MILAFRSSRRPELFNSGTRLPLALGHRLDWEESPHQSRSNHKQTQGLQIWSTRGQGKFSHQRHVLCQPPGFEHGTDPRVARCKQALVLARKILCQLLAHMQRCLSALVNLPWILWLITYGLSHRWVSRLWQSEWVPDQHSRLDVSVWSGIVRHDLWYSLSDGCTPLEMVAATLVTCLPPDSGEPILLRISETDSSKEVPKPASHSLPAS